MPPRLIESSGSFARKYAKYAVADHVITVRQFIERSSTATADWFHLASRGHLRYRPGPKEPALRKARICYDHLAGDYGVRMLDSLVASGSIEAIGEGLALTETGESDLRRIGIDVGSLRSSRRPLCRSCLDWSERRAPLAGGLGKALLSTFLEKDWARRATESRSICPAPHR